MEVRKEKGLERVGDSGCSGCGSSTQGRHIVAGGEGDAERFMMGNDENENHLRQVIFYG